MKKVLVTGIGGGVGQGILRNLRQEGFDITIVGTNTARVSAGNHLCDSVHVVPFAYEPEFLPKVAEIIEREQVDLVIPSTDYETYHLMAGDQRLAARVAASPAATSRMCLDKYRTYLALNQQGVPFATSALPSEYEGQFERTVVKPREGRGSRGVHIDPADPKAFDDGNLVQEYLDGDELTTSFYVRIDGSLHGFITFRRELEQGNTVRCEVTREHDGELAGIIGALIAAFPFRGSCNLQTRATSRGVVPFEINCRISGTNSIRSQFGFRDVAYTIQEYLYDRPPDAPIVSTGCAIRMMMDIIYQDIALEQVDNRFDDYRIS